jgi:small subunit ribosomal protein S8
MSMSDPIADLLTRIRNAGQVGHVKVDIPASRLKAGICRVLKEEGFIEDYSIDETRTPALITVTLRYAEGRSHVMQGMRRVSKPSLRVYMRSKEMQPVRSGLGIAIVSTSRGLMTAKHARQNNIGGEVICEVW